MNTEEETLTEAIEMARDTIVLVVIDMDFELCLYAKAIIAKGGSV